MNKWERFADWLRYHPRVQGFLAGVAVCVIAVLLASCGGGGPIPPADGQAATDRVSWILATQREDGSALPQADILETLIQWGTVSGGPYSAGSVRVAAPATAVNIARVAPGLGTRCYVAFTVLRDTAPTPHLSNSSNEACKTVVAPPRPPGNLAVE